MKKILSLLLCLSLLFTISVNTCAINLPTDVITNQISPYETVQVKSITEEEYLQRKALYENKSLASITNEYYSQKNIRSTVSNVFKEYSYTRTYSGNSSFKATVTATYQLQGSGNYYDIVDCTGIYSKIAEGIGTSSWTPGSTSVKILSPSNSYITANGYYQTTVDRSSSLSGGIGGFSVTDSTAWSITFTSGNHNLSKTVTPENIKYGT